MSLAVLCQGFLDALKDQGRDEAELADAMLAVALLAKVRAAAPRRRQQALDEHQDVILDQLTNKLSEIGRSLESLQ